MPSFCAEGSAQVWLVGKRERECISREIKCKSSCACTPNSLLYSAHQRNYVLWAEMHIFISGATADLQVPLAICRRRGGVYNCPDISYIGNIG